MKELFKISLIDDRTIGRKQSALQSKQPTIANILLMQTLFLCVGFGFWGGWAFFLQPNLLKAILFSSLFGGLVAFLPAFIFAYLLRYLSNSVMGLIANELIKISLTIALFALFIGIYSQLDWLPLLTSYLLVLKSSWLVLIRK